MSLLSPGVLEALLLATACAAAAAMRPWRLLAHGSRYSLAGPLACALAVVPLLWWWPATLLSPLFVLFGANLVLLALGWPLAVLVFTVAAAVGLLAGAGWAAAGTAFWHGVLPATLGVALGHAVRTAVPNNPVAYLLGRGFLVPLACTFTTGWLANFAVDRFQWLGAHATAALTLSALLDAMFTGAAATLLVIHAPRCLATWSDHLYARPVPGCVPGRSPVR